MGIVSPQRGEGGLQMRVNGAPPKWNFALSTAQKWECQTLIFQTKIISIVYH